MIAEVIVDIASSEVDRIFDYIAPEDEGICAGMRVMIPFGSRLIEGYVIRLKESSELSADKLKPVCRTLESYPVIGKELLALADYMTAQYNIRLVDALRLFIPAEMRRGRVKELSERRVRLCEDYRGGKYVDFVRKNSVAMLELCEYLDSGDWFTSAEINRSYSASALRNLVARGMVEVTESEVRRVPYKRMPEQERVDVVLTDAQQGVLSQMLQQNACYLLHGVTGSGKTEVYMHLIENAVRDAKSVIMLVPEIGLTPQVLSSFRARFGQNVALLHSGLSAGERFDEWRRLLSGEASIAVGARSAIFAPLSNVGVIIIDEEHDSSYVSDSNPRYTTSEIAEFRRAYNDCTLVLGSATPSVDTYYKAMTGSYALVELPERINKQMPQVVITDMRREVRGGAAHFSSALLEGIEDCLNSGEQAMLFINRRGYASFMMCRACGFVAKCTDCDVSLVYHRDESMLKCHYCANRYQLLDACPDCGASLRMGYLGTEKIVELIRESFPSARILRMDNDTTRGKDAHYEILEKFRNREADILIGTQMIAKGHDFPMVTLVGIVDADMSLHYSDYRAAERTYQLITQMSGRAGRAQKAGKVILQTYMPKHYVYMFAAASDYRGFYDKEINVREVTKYPPFTKIVRVLVSSEQDDKAAIVVKELREKLAQYFANKASEVLYFGVMRAPIKRIQNKYRYQILMRFSAQSAPQNIAAVYRFVDQQSSRGVLIFTDIDPQNLN